MSARRRGGGAMAFIRLVASLGGGAILIWILYTVGFPLLSKADARTDPGDAGAVANDWLRTAAENWPMAFLGIAFFGFIVLAVYDRGGG